MDDESINTTIAKLWDSTDYTTMRPLVSYIQEYGYPRSLGDLLMQMDDPPRYIPSLILPTAVDCVGLAHKFTLKQGKFTMVGHEDHAAAASECRFVDIGAFKGVRTLKTAAIRSSKGHTFAYKDRQIEHW
jgi:hypothetical protein